MDKHKDLFFLFINQISFVILTLRNMNFSFTTSSKPIGLKPIKLFLRRKVGTSEAVVTTVPKTLPINLSNKPLGRKPVEVTSNTDNKVRRSKSFETEKAK
jgi:hypothetical protein